MFVYRRIPLLLLSSVFLLSTACGGGGSSSGNNENSTQTTPEYTVSVQLGEGGDADPRQLVAREGEQASIELIPDAGFRVWSASGCGGSLQDNIYTTGPLTSDCEVSVEFIPRGSLSGQLLPAPGTTVDQTINDKRAPLGDNGQCANAQAIDNRATLHGFASAVATGGDPEQEHYAETSNSSDYYRVFLNVGQMVQLEVSDYPEGDNNLELHLWNSDCSQNIDSSTEGGEVEQVSSVLGGENVIEVRAQAGISKYVLRVTTAWDSTSDAEELQALSRSMPVFVPDEVILTFEPAAGNQAHQAADEALQRAVGLQLNYRHQDPSRATLAQIQPTGGLAHLAASQLDVMEDLKLLDEAAYDIINNLRVMDLLAQQPEVRHAEPNFLLNSQRTPNDPAYDNQWHYGQIQLPQAWDETTGERADGGSTVVAVLDTGVYLGHEDLQGQLLSGHDFHDNDSDADDFNSNGDSSWHGTHVAGTIAAATDNNTGVAGVSWAAKIMPVRVLGDEGGSRYNVMQGVRYAAGMVNDSGALPERPADVINLSLGGGGHSSAEQNLYHEVRNAGIFIVAAAGNDNSDQPMYPAAYDGVLSVSATNCSDKRSSYSNYGPTISLAAPGGDTTSCVLLAPSGTVLSTVGNGSNGSRTSSYQGFMGTSMASPHVAGVVALMRAVYPNLTPTDVDNLLRSGELTDDLGETGRDDQFGYGRINAFKAVQAAQALADGNTQWPAQVVADPSALYMGQESEATVELRQEGEGQAPAVTDWQSQAEWLAVTRDQVDENNLGTYRVTVNRDLFSEDDSGEHQSELVFSLEDGSELRVSVHIQVGSASESAPIYVLLLDAETSEPAYEAIARLDSAGELRYQLDGIVPGTYILTAGSDIDADGYICQPGEICGAYPSFNEREIITVTDEAIADLDFALDILTRFRPFATEAPREGIPRI